MTPSFFHHIAQHVSFISFDKTGQKQGKNAHPRQKRFSLCQRHIFLSLGLALLLSGCQNRTPTNTVIDWTHDFLGGEISKLHAPTPGFDRPYPNITQIPTTIPEFPSPATRALITSRLEEKRNFAERYGAASGALPTDGHLNPRPPFVSTAGSMTVSTPNSTKQPSPKTAPQPKKTSHAQPRSTAPSTKSQPASQLVYQPLEHTLPAYLPNPGLPPKPLLFPGFTLPDTILPLVPDFDVKTPSGTLIRFQADTDHILDGQDNSFRHIVAHRRHHRVIIRGFGTILSAHASLDPDDQQHEIALGLLRAQVVATNLIALGVPKDDIRILAEPIGDGVRVTYELNIKMPLNHR